MSARTARISDDQDLLIPVVAVDSVLDIASVTRIRSSPYHEHRHWLDLTKETINYQIIALALQSFHPVTEKYAFDSYHESFNISEIVQLIKQYSEQIHHKFTNTSVHIVAFRSILHDEVKQSSKRRQFLAEVDKASHLEANESGGLLKYWFGVPDDENGQNLATCWWVSKNHAIIGGGGKAHRSGMKVVKSWFKHWKVEEYQLVVNDNASSYTFRKTA